MQADVTLTPVKDQQVSSSLLVSSKYSGRYKQYWFEWCLALRLISKSSSYFTKLLVIVPSAPITIGITVIFMFHSFFVFYFYVPHHYYYYNYYFIALWVFFPTSFSKWYFLGFWKKACLLKFTRLFSVFWPISTILLFLWSQIVLRFSTLQASFTKTLKWVASVLITRGITVT